MVEYVDIRVAGDQSYRFMRAGLRGDRTQIAAMQDALKNRLQPQLRRAALHALAQLGVADAIPTIDSIIADRSDPDLAKLASVQKARLLVEAEPNLPTDPTARPRAKVLRFMNLVGFTIADLNNAVAGFDGRRGWKPLSGGRYHLSLGPPDPPVTVYAARELSDMLYRGAYASCIGMPELAGIDFESNEEAGLKMRLAPLSDSERLETMINELAHKENLVPSDRYEIQLAADEGLAASQAAAVKLREMMMQTDQNPRTGFTALVRVISATGDQQQRPLVAALDSLHLVDATVELDALGRGVALVYVNAY